MKNNRYVVAALVALAAATPLSALAQAIPSYAEAPSPYADGEENIHGRIVSFNGAYDLRVRDNRGYIDDVELHQGTIINPTGITLQPGMVVSILGYNAGSYLAANEVDTPYTFYGGLPYWEGHPWNYYGPTVSLGLFFGSLGWWHGSELHTGYHYVGGVRVYRNIHVHNIYVHHGGVLHGRDVVAAPRHGGYYPHGGGVAHESGPGGAHGHFGHGGGGHHGGGHGHA